MVTVAVMEVGMVEDTAVKVVVVAAGVGADTTTEWVI